MKKCLVLLVLSLCVLNSGFCLSIPKENMKILKEDAKKLNMSEKQVYIFTSFFSSLNNLVMDDSLLLKDPVALGKKFAKENQTDFIFSVNVLSILEGAILLSNSVDESMQKELSISFKNEGFLNNLLQDKLSFLVFMSFLTSFQENFENISLISENEKAKIRFLMDIYFNYETSLEKNLNWNEIKII